MILLLLTIVPNTPVGGVELVPGTFGADATTSELELGIVPSYTDENGREREFEYDSDHNLTEVTYTADGSYEEYSYNSFGQKTRIRNRNGEVSLFTYDSQGLLLSKEVGLTVVSGVDTPTAAYAETIYEYYPSSHANEGMLKYAMDPLHSSSNPTMHRTDYEYNTVGLVTKVIQPAAVSSGTRPETLMGYTDNLLTSVTDPESRTTSYEYDLMGRVIETTYPDTSTEQTLYASVSGADAGRIAKTKGRTNCVTYYDYDDAGRLETVTAGAAIDSDILDGNADDTVVTDVNQKDVTSYTYAPGSATIKTSVTHNGAVTWSACKSYRR